MESCVSKIDWEKIKEQTHKTKKEDCHNCEWYKNIVCKMVSPCLKNELQILHDAINDLKEKQDNIINGLRGKAEAEYKKSGPGL